MLARNSSSSTASETPARTRRLTSGVGEKSRRGASCAAAFALAKALATRTSAARPSRREKGIPVLGNSKGRARGVRATKSVLSGGEWGVRGDSVPDRGSHHSPPSTPHSLPPLQSRQQLVVVGSVRDPLDQPLHSRLWGHLGQAAAEGVDVLQLVGTEELLLAPGAARRDVDRRVDPLLG